MTTRVDSPSDSEGGVTSPIAVYSIASLHAAYASGTLTPRALVRALLPRITQDAAYNAWISVLDEAALEPWLQRLETCGPADLPLYGVPFAIKDNIDLAGVPTTAACPGFAYVPATAASAVQRLLDAGALPLGKTNLDQFATGLNGTRSPYGACVNATLPGYISGGSSSGSAVAVALGHVCFSLGTDTAGSGRVPAALNGIVGWKPSHGLVSAMGMLPACQTLDCMTVFANGIDDVRAVRALIAGFDAADPYARHEAAMAARALPVHAHADTIAVARPSQLQWIGSGVAENGAAHAYAAACARLRALGCTLVEVDIEPLLEAGTMLYGGPWLAERWLAVRDAFARLPEEIDPAVRALLPAADAMDAASAFAGLHRLAALRQHAHELLATVGALMLPTTGGGFRIEEMLAEPLTRNAALGRYTTFANLLDLAAVAVPSGADAMGLPFGVSFLQRAGSDDALLDLAARFLRDGGADGRTGGDWLELAVCGAHMRGLPLNGELTSRGGRFLRSGRTQPTYTLHALAGTPRRPGLVRRADGDAGGAIDLEVWLLPAAALGSFTRGIPAPLGLGRVLLDDGTDVLGFLCEAAGVVGAEDVTAFGGWRAWLARPQG
jgi:allophanate hydrolase